MNLDSGRIAALAALPLVVALGGCGGASPGSPERGAATVRGEPRGAAANGGACTYQKYDGTCELVAVIDHVRPSSCGDRDGEIIAAYRPTAASWVAPDEAVEVTLSTDAENHRSALRLLRKQKQVPCRLELLRKGSCAPERLVIDVKPAPVGWTEADKQVVEDDPLLSGAALPN